MTRILALDTSTDACSVALLTPDGVTEDFRLEPRGHTRLILPMIDALLARQGLELSQLDAIAFGRGPGSFTGLRIAAGVVQGLAWGAGLPVVAVSTLAAMALDSARRTGRTWAMPILDARMDEVYTALYRIEDGLPREVATERVCAPESLQDMIPPEGQPLVAAGSGLVYQSRFPETLRQRIQESLADLLPRAAVIAELAARDWREGRVLPPEQAQPVYLRDEVAWNKLPGR